jgi:hypothetical protein
LPQPFDQPRTDTDDNVLTDIFRSQIVQSRHHIRFRYQAELHITGLAGNRRKDAELSSVHDQNPSVVCRLAIASSCFFATHEARTGRPAALRHEPERTISAFKRRERRTINFSHPFVVKGFTGLFPIKILLPEASSFSADGKYNSSPSCKN